MVDPRRPPFDPILDPVSDRLGVAADVPIVLLPVRVETRWFVVDATHFELRIRVFPDDLHLAPEHPISPSEHASTIAYWQARLAGGEATDATLRARTALVQHTSESRAAFLIRTLAPLNGALPPAPAGSPQPAPLVARGLPAHWMAIGRIGDRRAFEVSGRPLAATLPVVPLGGADGGGLALPEEARWLHDFDKAFEIGMAMKVVMAADTAHALDELVVLGIPATDPVAGGRALGELLAAHAQHSASCLAPGTPTNRTADDVLAPRAIGVPPTGSDGAALARALGVEPAVLQDVAGAASSSERILRAMQTALWPSTWGEYLENQIGALPDATVRTARSHYLEYVRGAGPLSILQLGAQPYGLLPVCAWRAWPAGVADAWLAGFLRDRARSLHDRTQVVPRVIEGGDVDGVLERILSTPPWSTTVDARGVHAPDDVEASDGGLFGLGDIQEYLEQVQESLDALPWIAAGFPGTPALHAMIYDDDELRVRIRMVGANPDAPLSDDRNYLTALAGATIDDIRANRIAGSTPRTLLYVLARTALLLAEVRVADAVLATPLEVRRGREASDSPFARIAAAARRIPGTHLPIEWSECDQVRAALRVLATAPVGVLEHALAMVLDTASHRVDAWLTSLATKRLAAIRQTQSQAVIGAWCWLERPRPVAPVRDLATPLTGGGYVHAPSLGQARTAAILRAGYEAHRDDAQTAALALDLSSARVRGARELLDGVRAGQPLGVVLGYRIERLLHTAQADHLIDDLRAAFPRDDQGGVATHVVDGWRAYEAWRVDEPTDPALLLVWRAIAEQVDAVADLLVAEAVHQTARGNAVRAGAALDNLDRGDAPIVEPAFTATPADGRPRTSRVVLALPASGGWPGNAHRARACAAPACEAWAAQVLGAPADIAVSVRTATRSLTWTAADLDLCALDVVAWSENDGAPLLELCAAIATRSLGEHATVEPARGFAAAVTRASTIQRAWRDARTATARDLGGSDATPTFASPAVSLGDVITTLASGTHPSALLALVGPANALAPDAAVAALRGRSPADLVTAILGDAIPRAGAIAAWPAASVELATPSARATWLADHATVRPALQALDLIALVSPDAIGDGATLAFDGGIALVFGAQPLAGTAAIVIDAFSTSPTSNSLTTGVAVHQQAPRARAPQSILIAVTPPSASWTVRLLESTVLDTIELARLRMLEPHQVNDHYLPALHLAEELDQGPGRDFGTIGVDLSALDVVRAVRS